MRSMDLIGTSVSIYTDGKYGPYLNERVRLCRWEVWTLFERTCPFMPMGSMDLI